MQALALIVFALLLIVVLVLLTGAMSDGSAALGTRDHGGVGCRGTGASYRATTTCENVFVIVALRDEVHLGEDAVDTDFFGIEARTSVVTVSIFELF